MKIKTFTIMIHKLSKKIFDKKKDSKYIIHTHTHKFLFPFREIFEKKFQLQHNSKIRVGVRT